MVKRSVAVRLRDILEAMDEADEYLEQKDFAFYQSHSIVQRAVERCIEIVSEASRHIPASMTAKHPEVPWPEIRAIGNFMRHDYQRVEDHVIWRTAAVSFVQLKPVILEMLASVENE